MANVTQRIKNPACFIFTLAAAITCSLTSNHAHANLGEAYGFGAQTEALANAGAAYGFGGYAAYNNPAALPFSSEQRLQLSISLVYLKPSFKDITNVVVENEYTSDKVTYSDVDTDYRSTFGAAVAANYRILPNVFNLTAGLVAFLPLESTTYMDTGETFVPEYVLYRSRTQRPQVEIGLGADLGHGFKVGAGLHTAFTLTSAATVFLQTDATKPSTMRFTASLKPKLAPYFGAHYSFKPADAATERFALGVVFRLPVSSPNTMYLRSGARAFGSFAALDFNFKANSALYYDPFTIELGGMLAENSWLRTVLQVDFQGWGSFKAPALALLDPQNESCGDSPCGVNISPGKNPGFSYRNIIVPRFAQEIDIKPDMTLRLGYAYRPSIFKSLPTEAGNYLDPSKHLFTAGLGLKFSRFMSLPNPCTLDFAVTWQKLSTQTIVKSPGDENGTTTGTSPVKIGSPGYQAGGNIFGGGVTLGLLF